MTKEKYNNQRGSFNTFTHDLDSVVTAKGKHCRVMVSYTHDTIHARVDLVEGLPAPTLEQIRKVAKVDQFLNIPHGHDGNPEHETTSKGGNIFYEFPRVA